MKNRNLTALASIARWLLTASLLVLSFNASAMTADDMALLRKKNPSTPNSADGDALQAASRLAAANDVDALGEIVQLGDAQLLDQYARNYAAKGNLPEAVEKIILAMMRDSERRLAALELIGAPGDCRRTYRSRELFDSLRNVLMEASNPVLANEVAWRIACTSRHDLEMSFIELLRKAKPQYLHGIIQYLGKQGSVKALPALQALLISVPIEQSNSVHWRIHRALLDIGTPEAMEILYRRIAWMAANRLAPGVENGAMMLISDLDSPHTRTAKIRYSRVRALLTAFPLSPSNNMINVVKKLKDPSAVRDLMPLVDGKYGADAAEAILEIGAPNDWVDVDAAIKRAGPASDWTNPQRNGLRERIKRAIAEPQKTLAERADLERKQAFAAARKQLEEPYSAATNQKETDPERYAIEVANYLKRAKKLIAANPGRDEAVWYRRDVAQVCRSFAAYTRFALHDSANAVSLYEQAIALSEGLPARDNLALLERIFLADTLRFDFKDSPRALQIYRQLLQKISSTPPSSNADEAAMMGLLTNWLNVEIAFLAEGKRYAGTPDGEMLDGIAMMFLSGMGAVAFDDPPLASIVKILYTRAANADEKREFAHQLEALTPSQTRFLGAFGLLPLLGSPERISDFMRKHDPAGFVTASAFAIWGKLEQQFANEKLPPEMAGAGMNAITWTASDRELMHKAETLTLGRQIIVNIEPDPRLASPELAWKNFLDALRAADLDAAWKCTTPGIRNKFERGFKTMTHAQLIDMANSTVVFQRSTEFGEFVEATVVKMNGNAGIVCFVRQGKEWRISEM